MQTASFQPEWQQETDALVAGKVPSRRQLRFRAGMAIGRSKKNFRGRP
jgi:hypothetical protein